MEKLLQKILDVLTRRHIDHTEYVTKTKTVHKGPAEIGGITITGTGGAAVCQIYDGENAQGRQLCDLRALNGTSFSWPIVDHTDVDDGIHIVVTGGNTGISIHYHPANYKTFR